MAGRTGNAASGDVKDPTKTNNPAFIAGATGMPQNTVPDPTTNRNGYFDGEGFWHDLGNYAVDAFTGRPAIRLGQFAVNGDWQNFGAQLGNMGGTPYGAHIFGQASGQPLAPNSGAFDPAPTKAGSVGEWVGRGGKGVLGAYSGQAAVEGLTNLSHGGQSAMGGIGGSYGGPLNAGQFDFDMSGYDESGDQSAFTYQEALDRATRAYSAGDIRDPFAVSASYLRDPYLGDARETDASGPASVERYSGARIEETGVDPAAQAVFGGVGRASFDADPSNQVRADQLGDIAALRDAAAGRGPSAAADEYEAALNRASRERQHSVNMLHGADKAAARQEQDLALGRDAMVAAREAAALRAREQQAAQAQLGQQTSAVRSADIDVAGKIAALDQQANEVEAQLRTAVAQGNRDAINQLTSQKAQIASQRAIAQAANNQSATAAGAQAANQAQLDYAARLDAAARENADRVQRQATAQGQLTLQRDTAAGQQSLDAQKTTNEQRLQRDVAADNAGRSAFTSTTDAQIAALGQANAATGQRTQAAQGKTTAQQQAYDLALKQQLEAQKLAAADRQGDRVLQAGLLEAGKDLFNKFGSKDSA